MRLCTVPLAIVTLCSPALMPRLVAGDAPEPRLVLQYDFFDVQGDRVGDGSGHDHAGTLTAGTVVQGRRKPAVQLAGTGRVATESLGRDGDLARHAITVGAMCKPEAADGVIASMGDSTDGFVLYLKGGIPHFAVRSGGELHQVQDTEPSETGRCVHLAGVIGADGGLSLLVNTFPVATSAGRTLGHTPAGPFLVGAEPGAPVGTHSAAGGWQGLIEDVRLYDGAVSRGAHRDLLGDWANRPGCGCKK
jgi:hypothetical protein